MSNPTGRARPGAILFQIERAPYDYKVKQLQAALAEARQKAAQLQGSADLAAADVKAVSAQLSLAERRRDDIERLALKDAASQFRLQDATTQAELLAAQREAAQAREANARLALGSAIEGGHTTVAQILAQLENAQWELEQTTVCAPADGYASAMALAVGA